MPKNIQAVRGMSDRLPADQLWFDWILRQFRRKAEVFNFNFIETPTVEFAALFDRSVGKVTDIVEKEMFEVNRLNKSVNVDQTDTDTMVLRPEGTAPIARAYIENGMNSLPQPVMLAYASKMYRYDRPQKGRLREFNQIGIEIIGDRHPINDALAILVAWQVLDSLRLRKFCVLEINTIGDVACKPKITKAVQDYFKQYSKHLCTDCQNRIKTQPLRILDCKNENCQAVVEGAPQLVDLVCPECNSHFQAVLEYLDELDIPYELNPRLVRGLDYYTRTTFEIRLREDERRQNALGGGGRYDELMKILGGKDAPGIGWALGVERIIEALKENKITPPPAINPAVMAIQIGERARKLMIKVVATLAKRGIKVATYLSKDILKSQLKTADKLNVRWALIVGQKEAYDQTVIIRNLEDRSQETVPLEKIDQAIIKRIKK